MASRAYEGRASALPDLSAILSSISSLPRPILSRLTARMIERLDEIDGDPDLEAANDEDVPDFRKRRRLRNSQRARAVPGGPGCPIGDPGGGSADDEGERETWSTYHAECAPLRIR